MSVLSLLLCAQPLTLDACLGRELCGHQWVAAEQPSHLRQTKQAKRWQRWQRGWKGRTRQAAFTVATSFPGAGVGQFPFETSGDLISKILRRMGPEVGGATVLLRNRGGRSRRLPRMIGPDKRGVVRQEDLPGGPA